MDIIEKIKKLKEKKNAVILAHYYVEPKVQEIADYIDRAILIRKSEIIDDLSVDDIEKSGSTLIEIVKEKYDYRADRIRKAVDQMK